MKLKLERSYSTQVFSLFIESYIHPKDEREIYPRNTGSSQINNLLHGKASRMSAKSTSKHKPISQFSPPIC